MDVSIVLKGGARETRGNRAKSMLFVPEATRLPSGLIPLKPNSIHAHQPSP